MTLLTMCQDAADEIGVPQPSTIIGNTDPTAKRLLRAANRIGKELAKRDWQVLTKEASFTSTATESQGALTTIASDFNRFKNNTMWNRTQKWRIYGPVTDNQWQRMLAAVTSGVHNFFRIRGGNIIVYPTMTASESVYFEYISDHWVDSGTGATPAVADAAKFDNDANTVVFDEDLMTIGIVWQFRRIAGVPYQEQQAEYEARLKDQLMQDGAKAVINMNGTQIDGLGTNIPEVQYGI